MKSNITSIINIYLHCNKNKYALYLDTKRSYADHVYGTLILAIALNSEFVFMDSIDKVVMAIILESFKDVPDMYIEYTNLSSYERSYINMCSNLDIALDNVIDKNFSMSIDDLFSMTLEKSIFTPRDEQQTKAYFQVFRFFYMNQVLKNLDRSGWDSRHWNINLDRREKVSEHVYGTAVLALAINTVKRHNKIEKIVKMIILHEIGAALIGDITPEDGIIREDKRKYEREAMSKALGSLSDKVSLLALLYEFDNRNSIDSTYAYLCDKLETDIQCKVYQDMGVQREITDQSMNIDFLRDENVKRLETCNTAFEYWYKKDIHLYENDELFLNIFEFINSHNLN